MIGVAGTMLWANAMALPVIPGAVGFGMDTPAGRGGEIIKVTNLQDTGAGSLRACVEAPGARICVFEVSGTIRLDQNLKVTQPNLTIAGQTAPAPGIMLRGAALQIMASDVLVQHIAVRAGDSADGPAYSVRDALKIIGKDELIQNIVIDHSSFSWGLDENVEVFNTWDNVTISNTIIAEPLRDSVDPSGPHGLGVLIIADRENSSISLIGNLLAHQHGRNPRSAASEFVLVNNVIYNARGAEAMLFNDSGMSSINTIVGNVFIKGQDSYESVKPIRVVGPTLFGPEEVVSGTKIYLANNSASCATSDPWSIVDNQSLISRILLEASDILVWPGELQAMPTDNVLDYVLENAGTRPGYRNDADASVVSDVRNGTGRIINCVADNGTARCAKNAGGWPELAKNTRSLTLPESPNADDDGDGYTNVEEWLHVMAAEVEGRTVADAPDETPTEPPATPATPPKPPQLQEVAQ